MPSRVLVIEDNPANLELMTYLLEAFGYATSKAVDGAGGLELARREVPDLVVCDIQLPDLDGYEVARRLKADATLNGIPLVAVTALAMVGDRRRIMDAGFDGYIAKPIDPESFVTEIEAFLRPEQRCAPLPRDETTHDPHPGSPPATATGLTILVVDDLPSNIELVRSILVPFGYQVISAASVDEAIALTRNVVPAMIISDVNMPGRNGYELLEVVKATPELSGAAWVFLASSPCTARERQEALTLGADRFILRPVDPEVLLEEIKACLNARGRS
jgi:two-component system cell cycle response regulator